LAPTATTTLQLCSRKHSSQPKPRKTCFIIYKSAEKIQEHNTKGPKTRQRGDDNDDGKRFPTAGKKG